MPEQTTIDPETPAGDDDSGAGYGNNAQTDDIGKPGQEEEVEAHPS